MASKEVGAPTTVLRTAAVALSSCKESVFNQSFPRIVAYNSECMHLEAGLSLPVCVSVSETEMRCTACRNEHVSGGQKSAVTGRPVCLSWLVLAFFFPEKCQKYLF